MLQERLEGRGEEGRERGKMGWATSPTFCRGFNLLCSSLKRQGWAQQHCPHRNTLVSPLLCFGDISLAILTRVIAGTLPTLSHQLILSGPGCASTAGGSEQTPSTLALASGDRRDKPEHPRSPLCGDCGPSSPPSPCLNPRCFYFSSSPNLCLKSPWG